jgi:hypothetical protein
VHKDRVQLTVTGWELRVAQSRFGQRLARILDDGREARVLAFEKRVAAILLDGIHAALKLIQRPGQLFNAF